MAKVAIIGVGAIGGSLAAGLAQRDHELFLCTRRPLEGALRVETPTGEVQVKAQNLTSPEQATAVDWVVVATKTYDIEGTAAWFARLCGPTTRVAIVQNGVEHRKLFAPYLAQEKIVPVIIYTPAERRSDGSIWQRMPLDMKVADDPAGHAFAEIFPGGNVEVVQDFLTTSWQKLCLNATGAICAILMKPVGVMSDEQLGLVALDLVGECVAVGRAEGAKLDDDIGKRILASDRARHPDSINSMLADRMAGKPTEIDARHGVIVRLGEKHGIPTPTNRMASALIVNMSASS